MKIFFKILFLVCLFSCSNENVDFQNEDEITVDFADTKRSSNPLASTFQKDIIKFKIEMISYLIGRTLINNSNARIQFVNLSMLNDGIININLLFNSSDFSKFRTAFQLEYYRFWLSQLPGRPGDESFGIEPYEYTPDQGGSGHQINTFLEFEKMVAIKYDEFIIYLSENNCLELFFPIPINFNTNDLRITTVVARYDSTIDEIKGGELYRFEERNAGDMVLINRNYMNNILFNNNNNLLIVRPITNDSICDEYPFD